MHPPLPARGLRSSSISRLGPLALLALILPISARGADVGPPPAPGPATSSGPAEYAVVESQGSYTSQGKTIAVERFEPKAEGKRPAVLILHGSLGMTIGGPTFRDMARQLARKGYVAQVVHYFDLTGTRFADMATMRGKFPEWLLAVRDGLTAVARQPNVDPERIGMVGYSLGGYLSLALAVFDPRVAAVVDYFGGLPPELHGELKSLPPTLILHGDIDRVVPVREAHTLESLCQAKGVPFELKVYPGQGHFFLGDAALDAARRTLSFLDQHVARAGVARVKHEVARPRLDLLPGGPDAIPPAARAAAAAAVNASQTGR